MKKAETRAFLLVYPDWTTGFWQCKLRYGNQSQVMDAVNGYIDRDIPISLIIIE
jgi:alpha-D-xyloside xylohydrolase